MIRRPTHPRGVSPGMGESFEVESFEIALTYMPDLNSIDRGDRATSISGGRANTRKGDSSPRFSEQGRALGDGE